MTATLSTLRIGETIDARGEAINSDGTFPGELQNVVWSVPPPAASITIVQDGADPYLVHVTGVASGSDLLHVNGEDAYSVQHAASVTVTVLNASHIRFSLAALLLEPDPDAASITGVKVVAWPWDSREEELTFDYAGITNILWSSANGAVLFGGTAGGSPPGTATLSGTLEARIFPDTTSGMAELTTDVVTVAAKNSDGTDITGSFPVTIRRVTSVTIQQA